LAGDTNQLTIYTDGASRGNPGPAAAGFVIIDSNNNELAARGIYLGQATNNVAEYNGMIKAIEAAMEFSHEKLTIFSDSELMVRQINGQYKVKSDLLRPLYQQVIDMLGNFKSWQVKHVTRDKNTKADSLCNQSLDLKKDVKEEAKPAKPQKKLRLGVLLSGGGRTMLNILDCIERGELNAEIPLVISSRSVVKGVERAKNAGLGVEIIRTKDYPDIDSFSKQIADKLNMTKIDLVIQAGWLCLWKIPQQYKNRVMNIHPALLPSFGGKGMWGHHVHEAVLKAGCKISGCTVHFCTNEYDNGPIIVQRCCRVEPRDDADNLADRVFEQECLAYPEAIKLFAQDRIQVEPNRTIILPE
jgi:formyltetrahydrofolate-dependent phosphoribosylglycinamide formyltransferase